MIKKIISFVILLIMVFSFSACSKATPPPAGYFYDLSEAYEKGWITKDDLKSMAYYKKEIMPAVYYDNMDSAFGGDASCFEDFVPVDKTPEKLSAETEEKIKQAYVSNVLTFSEYPDAGTTDVSIYGYYGTYNGYTAVMINDNYHSYNGRLSKNYIAIQSFVPFIHFKINNSDIDEPCIFIWHDGQPEKIYSLAESYEQELLDEEDLTNISYYQREKCIENWSNNIADTPTASNLLSDETKMKIKQTRYDLTKEESPNANITLEGMPVGACLGTYNGYVVLSGGGWFEATETVIGDVLFMFTNIGFLQVWKENKE